MSQQLKIHVPPDASITATVGILMRAQGGFGLAVDLLASLPGVAPSEAHHVVEAAHQVCPYSNATDTLRWAVPIHPTVSEPIPTVLLDLAPGRWAS